LACCKKQQARAYNYCGSGVSSFLAKLLFCEEKLIFLHSQRARRLDFFLPLSEAAFRSLIARAAKLNHPADTRRMSFEASHFAKVIIIMSTYEGGETFLQIIFRETIYYLGPRILLNLREH